MDQVLKKMVGDNLAMIVDGEEKNREFDLSTRNLRKIIYLPQLVALENRFEL